MRSVLLTAASILISAGVIGNAFYQRQQFYPSVVYITKSSPSMCVMYIQALVCVVMLGKLMQKVFFGRLRVAELELMMERSWYAVTETCLAFTVFRDDFSPKFVALFTLLLFLKSFHWLGEDRVDFMERSPNISFFFRLRVVSLSALLAIADSYFIYHAYHSTLTKGASVQLVFGFEYAILLTVVIYTIVKYVLHSIDLLSDSPWESKAVFMLYADLVIGFVKAVLYLVFITIMVRIYTLPLFTLRPMYLTLRAFKKAYKDAILSRRAIHNMNTWYPDATQEEIASSDNVCIICREEMLAPSTKKLPCNHIFHKSCLRSWFQRQQTCPTCRLDVLRTPLPSSQAQPARPPPDQAAPNAPQHPPAAAPRLQHPPLPLDPQQFAQFLNQIGMGLPPPPSTTSAPSSMSSTHDATSATATVTTSSSTTPQTHQTTTVSSASLLYPPPPLPSFPMFTPPPPFSFPLPPPPMPPPNFAGMTDAEVAAMEGRERANVEARVKCLRNIQLLLDAAVLEMQQYTATMHNLHYDSVVIPSSTDAERKMTTTTTSTTTTTREDRSKGLLSAVPPELLGARPKLKKPSTLTATHDVNKDEVMIDKKIDDEVDGCTSDYPQEVRRLRLKKLASSTGCKQNDVDGDELENNI